MDFWTILLAAFMPIARALLMCSVGALLAHKRVGTITAEGRCTLSRLVANLFLPALTLDKLTKSLSPTTMLLWWPLPCFVGLNIAMGMLVGYVVGHVVVPRSLLGVFTATIAMGNYGNLALVLVPALCTDPHSPLSAVPQCQEQGIAYVMYGQWVANFFGWTAVYVIMQPPTYTDLDRSPSSPTDAEMPVLLPRPPGQSDPPTAPVDPPSMASNLGKQLLQPPIVSIAMALGLAVIPSAKGAIFDAGGTLRPLGACIETFSNGMIPMTMLILGSGLSRGAGGSSFPPRVIAVAVACRLLLNPLMGLSLLAGAEALGLLTPGDVVLRVVLLIQQCGPTSILLGTIANIHKHEVGTVSLTLFWQYLLVGPVMCLFLMAFFWLYGEEPPPVPVLRNLTSSAFLPA
eukprot:EG_transcript_10869